MSRLDRCNFSPSARWLDRDWALFGADSPAGPPLSFSEASAYCSRLAQTHYENFSVASYLLPIDLRRHFQHVYAFCRWSDDLADESSTTAEATARLSWWQEQLDDCFQGQPRHPVMIALQATIRTFQLESTPFRDLLSAFLQDQTVVRYEDDAQLIDYCRRSANPVGRILLAMARVDAPTCLAWSDQICTGLQLANFCQDVAGDAGRGRIYLPRSRWKLPGVDEAEILAARGSPALRHTIAAWAWDTLDYFDQGWQLSEHVPAWLARDIRLFAGGGMRILHKILTRGGDVWSGRIRVNRFDKLSLLLRACLFRGPPKRPRPPGLPGLDRLQAG
jgi:squalene synthase HpnC